MFSFARDYVIGLFNKMNSDGILEIPSFDCALSCGEIMDYGRLLNCHLDWDMEKALIAADEFGHFAVSLFEIGDWYSNSEQEYGREPDKDFMCEPKSMEVWNTYIKGYVYFPYCKEAGSFCREKNITGFIPEYFLFMANRYCKYSSIDAPSVVLDNALEELAHAYVINKFATKVERDDTYMDEKTEESFF